MGELGCLFGALVILVLLILYSGPLFIWLVVIIVLVAIVERLERQFKKKNETTDRGSLASQFASSLYVSFLDGLAETGLCIAGGLGIVILCNAGFRIFRWSKSIESPDSVLRVENWLVVLCHHLEADFKPNLPVLISILIGLAIIQKMIPKSRVINRWAAFQKLISRATIILMTISAFTFFTVQEVSRQEPQWVSEMRDYVKFSLDEIGKERKRILAEAIVEDRIESLPETSKAQLQQFFKFSAIRSDGRDITGLAATVLAHSDPEISRIAEQLSPPKPNSIDETITRASNWLNAGGASISISDVRVLHDEVFKEIHEEVAGETDLTRTFFKEVLGGILEATVPDKMSEVVERFLEIIVDSVSESISGAVFPDAEDLTSAKGRTMNREVAEILIPAQRDDRVWNLQALSHGVTVDVIVMRLGYYLQAHPSEIPKTIRETQDENLTKNLVETEKWMKEYRERRGETRDHPLEVVP